MTALLQQTLADEFSLPAILSPDQWQQALADAINRLIQSDFHRLVSILYRLDVSESKLKTTLQQDPGTDAGRLIAALIIERQLEKIKTRAQYPKKNDIPDEEKW